ncbi:MAG: helix-turn-helix domain-containing protein [Spirochaetales bacterium]|nr:helix-turn-helix domain-containing protein [Spirochaetales bacterium]
MSQFVNIAAISISLFSLIELLTERNKRVSRRYAFLVLTLIPLSLIAAFLDPQSHRGLRVFMNYNPLKHWTFLLGPFLYYYQVSVGGKRVGKRGLWHLLPFLIWNGVTLWGTNRARFTPELKRFYGITTLLSFAFYSIFILIKLRRHKKALGESLSYRDFFLELVWLEYIMKALLGITLFLWLAIPLNRHFNRTEGFPLIPGAGEADTVQLVHALALLVFVFFFSLFALKQNRISQVQWEDKKENEPPESGERKEKAGGASLNEEDQSAFEKIETHMKESALYLKSELNLPLLAEALDMNRNEVSRLINRATGGNFFHFVNGFRAREFRTALEENRFPDYTLLSIGLECGFNSKSTFNEAVKREWGKTPSQLYKELSQVS